LSYIAFGLIITSDIDFSDMLQDSYSEATTVIKKGDVKEVNYELTNVFRKDIQAEVCIENDVIYLRWQGILCCQIKNGNEIIYQHLGDTIQTLKLFLLSEAIGILLEQKGYFLLHGSAVLVGESAHVFVGEPGAGKSTMAATFWQEGHIVLSDDLVVLDVQADKIQLIPTFPQFKIWENAVNGLDINIIDLKPSFEGRNKYLISQPKVSFPFHPVSLESVSILNQSGENRQINSLESPIELLKHYPLPNQVISSQSHFLQSINITNSLKVCLMQRPKGFQKLRVFVKTFSA
jgi:hypothetical protein